MADRTSASLFAIVFEELAKDGEIDRKAFAETMWKAAGGYDFSWYQMSCDNALITLGLARKCEKCDGIEYRDEDHHRYCEDKATG